MKIVKVIIPAILGILFVLLIFGPAQAFGQTASIAPDVFPIFVGVNGITPVALGFVCTTASGGSSPKSTYQDSSNVTANQNPIRLNAAGQPVNGSSYVQIFLTGTYRFTVYAALTGGSPNCATGTGMGAQIRQVDPVFDMGQLILSGAVTIVSINNRQYCTSGANAGAKITAAMALLPSTGGIVDCTNLQGSQSITATITVSTPVTILLGGATFAASGAFPFNLTGAGASVIGMAGTASVLSLASGIDGIAMSSGTRVSGFTIRGPNAASVGNSCIEGGSSSQVTIDHMVIEQCGDHGINTGGASTDWDITHNIFNNQANNHILIGTASQRIRVIDNYFNNTSTTTGNNCVDMNGSNNVVSKNTMINCGREGGAIDDWAILMQAVAGSNADNNDIEGNIISGCGAQCIVIRGTAGQTANKNRIRGNSVTGAGQKTAGSGTGITIDGTSGGTASENEITDNAVFANSQHGILVDGSSATGTIIQGAIVSSNSLSANTGTGLYITGTNAIDAIADGNTIFGNGTPVNISGAIRPNLTNNKVNATAFGYTLGSDIAGATNNFTVRDNTAGANRLLIGSTGEVNAVSAFTVGSGGDWTKILIGNGALDFPNTNAQLSADLTITVTGAVDQDVCALGVPAASQIANTAYTCFVSAADTVTVRFSNYSAGALNPSSGSFKVTVIHF